MSSKEIEIDNEIDSESENEIDSEINSDDENSIDELTDIENNENTEIDENIIFDEIDPEKELNLNKRVPDEERISSPYLTKYEKVLLLGTRTKQISDGSDIYVISNNAKSAGDISKLELEYKRLPYKIKRPMPDGRYEIWSLDELEIFD